MVTLPPIGTDATKVSGVFFLVFFVWLESFAMKKESQIRKEK